MQQNGFLSLDFLQIETGTSFMGELNESAKKKGGHRRFDGVVYTGPLHAGGYRSGGVQLLLPGFCTPRLPGRSTWRPAEYPDNVSITGVFRSLTQPRTNKPIPKSPMSRDAQCAARNLDFDVGLCVGQTGLMGVH